MIGFIRGTILNKSVPRVLIEIPGLGYEVETSMTTFFQLPEVGETVQLFTHFTVREDAQILFGFIDEEERTLFRTLIKVNGVGPKLALAILSSISPQAFVHCVSENDVQSLTKIPGVGKKTAERLLIEMRDKIQDWHLTSVSTPASIANLANNQASKEAISALISLGYKPTEASRAVSLIAVDGMTSSELIRLALKGMLKA